MEQMKQIQEQLPALLEQAVETATMLAVEKATELTPPTGEEVRGTNTRTGELKQHWDADSQTRPQRQGNELVTVLANDVEYASYVNDGHRMDRHFVPGLYINPYSGLLEYDPSANAWIVWGTRSPYVPGVFMVDDAKKEYENVLREKLRKLEEMLQ